MILRAAIILFLACILAAVLAYPGGTQWNSLSSAYQFSENFLSDLGNSLAWNQRSNWTSMSWYIAANTLLALALIFTRKTFPRQLHTPLLVQGLCLIALCAFPFNRAAQYPS